MTPDPAIHSIPLGNRRGQIGRDRIYITKLTQMAKGSFQPELVYYS